MSQPAPKVVYEFSGFRLDPHQRLLLSAADDRPVVLTPKVFEMLLYMVERRGELLDKQTLMKALWPNVIVEDNNLNQIISAVRKALGETPGDHRFIVTEPGRGYRFVAEVIASVRQTEAPALPATRSAVRGSIAVLPFVNLTGDPSKEYFSDGLAEELIHTLASVPGLRVPARTSSFAYKGRNVDVRQIARDLKVEALIEGSVRSAGERIRVTAQLISGESGFHMWSQHYDRRGGDLWSRTYDRPFSDLFELQDELATAIVEALGQYLQIELPSVRQVGPTQDLHAYDLYLQARSLISRPSAETLRTAIVVLQKATDRDPNFARAFSAIGRCYVGLWRASLSFDPVELDQAEQAARRAVSLERDLAEARGLLAQITAFRGDWVGAQREYEVALSLSDTELTPYDLHNVLLYAVGHLHEALAQLHKADRLAPGLGSVSLQYSTVYSLLGRDAEAMHHANRAVNLGVSPDHWVLHVIRSHAAYRRGDLAEAGEHMVRALPADTREAGGADVVTLVYAALSDARRTSAAINALRSLTACAGPATSSISSMLMMHWYTMLEALDLAYEVAYAVLDRMRSSATVGAALWAGLWIPEMRPFRQDLRFKGFADALNMTEYWRQYGAPDGCELHGDTLICR